MILKLFKGIKWKELKWWLVIYPEIGCKKNLENGWELNPCSHTKSRIYFFTENIQVDATIIHDLFAF